MKIIPSIFVLFLLLDTSIAENSQSAMRRGDTHINSIQTSSGSHHQERSLTSIWSFFSFIKGPCLPGHLGEKCREEKKGPGNDAGGNSNNGSNGGDGSNGDLSSATNYDGGDGEGGDGSSSGNNSSSSSTTAGAEASSSGKSKLAAFMNSAEGQVTSIALATLAASVAIAAMYMGSRNRNGNGKKHALKGVLKQRIGLFSRMAGRSKCATCRPESVDTAVLEGNESGVDYRLAWGLALIRLEEIVVVCRPRIGCLRLLHCVWYRLMIRMVHCYDKGRWLNL